MNAQAFFLQQCEEAAAQSLYGSRSKQASSQLTPRSNNSFTQAATTPSPPLSPSNPRQDARELLAPELWLQIFSYVSPRVLATTCASVCRYWASLALESVKDREFAQHETFMLSQAQSFLGVDRYSDRIDEHLRESDLPLVVTGESGSGKSAALIQWISRFVQRFRSF